MPSDFVMDVLRFISDNDCHGSIWWRTDEEYAPITFFVNCNDCFYWATADCEDLTEENFPRLVKAYADAEAADPKRGTIYADELFVARERKMRPQGASYKLYPEALWPLFNACGPERDVDGSAFGNPHRQPSPSKVAGELAAMAQVVKPEDLK